MNSKIIIVIFLFFFVMVTPSNADVNRALGIVPTYTGTWYNSDFPTNLSLVTNNNWIDSSDGSISVRAWSNKTVSDNTYIQIDLGTGGYGINTITFKYDMSATSGTSYVNINVSSEGTTWTQIYSNSTTNPGTVYYNESVSGYYNVRYIRFSAWSSAGGSINQIRWNEIQAIEKNTSTLNTTMNEGSGSWANDSSGFNNNGSITGATWTTDSVNGSALSFDGSGDYVTILHSSSLNMSSFTQSHWIKPNNTGEWTPLNKLNTMYYYCNGVQCSFVLYYSASNYIQTPYFTLPTNTWSYVTVSYDGSTITVYLNNILLSTTADVQGVYLTTNNLLIGTYNAGIFNSKGVLDEIKIYNYALNASERTADYQQYQPVPAYPTGGMSLTGSSINFTWHDTEYPADELLVSMNPGYTALVYDSITTNDYANVSLPSGTYYWKVKQYNSTTATYGDTSLSNTVSLNVAASIPGRFNITAKDEQTGTTITNFNITIYNSTSVLTKSSTAGWANFSSAEVTGSEYLIRANASFYAPRSVLATSPGNVTVYLPNTNVSTNVNLIAFYLVDTTGNFPASGSKITITKNSSTMYSSYFDADMKASLYLVNGDSYSISISYGPNIQNWGNYIPVISGNVQIFLTKVAINTTQMQPFVYNITYGNGNSDITLNWRDSGGVLTSLNFTIYKGAAMAMVHQLVTTVIFGQSTYTITAPDVYYIYFTADTTQGRRYQVFAYDASTAPNITTKGKLSVISYGSYTPPGWIKDLLGILFIILLAGGFGAIYAELGGLISIVSVLFLMQSGFMSGTGAGIGFMGGLAVTIFLAYIKARDAGQVAMMAYKAAMFLIFFNFAILIINGSGIIPGAYVDIYGNNCQGANAGTPGCILARLSNFAPQESAEGSQSLMDKVEQIGLILVSATAFGLIILTLQYMLALFWFGLGISTIYLSQLPITWEWKLPLQVGIMIIYITGFMQYKAATSLQYKE